MSHLSPSEFVDLSDGTLPATRAAHVNGCEACRAQADIIRDALRLTGASAPVPEPSPLFWDHLSARVREAVAEAPSRSMFGSGWRGLQPLAAGFLVVALLFAAVVVTRDARQRSAPQTTRTSVPAAEPEHGADPSLDASHALEWAVLTAAAADLRFEEAHDAGMAVPAAAVDRAVTQLTRDELSELGRLLQSELKGTSNGS
jgi:hypothetical protein